MWDTFPSVAAQLADSSGGRFTLDKSNTLIVDAQIDVYSSTLGCAVDSYATKALTVLQGQGIVTSNYVFRCVPCTCLWL